MKTLLLCWVPKRQPLRIGVSQVDAFPLPKQHCLSNEAQLPNRDAAPSTTVIIIMAEQLIPCPRKSFWRNVSLGQNTSGFVFARHLKSPLFWPPRLRWYAAHSAHSPSWRCPNDSTPPASAPHGRHWGQNINNPAMKKIPQSVAWPASSIQRKGG